MLPFLQIKTDFLRISNTNSIGTLRKERDMVVKKVLIITTADHLLTILNLKVVSL